MKIAIFSLFQNASMRSIVYLKDFNDFLFDEEIWQGGVLSIAHQVKDWHCHVLHLLPDYDDGDDHDDDGDGDDDREDDDSEGGVLIAHKVTSSISSLIANKCE